MKKFDKTTLEILEEISTIESICQINIYDIDNERWGVDTAIELVFTTNIDSLVIDVMGEILRLHSFSEEDVNKGNIKDVITSYIRFNSEGEYEGGE